MENKKIGKVRNFKEITITWIFKRTVSYKEDFQ